MRDPPETPERGPNLRGVWLGLLAPVAIGVGVFFEQSGGSDASRISFLAVGQGDCAVVQSKGRTLLIDAGPVSDRFDAGERIVVPELRRLGVKTIDLVLVSHPDADHLGGLVSVARRFAIGEVAAPSCFRRDSAMLGWLEKAGFTPERVAWVSRRREVRLGTFDIRMDCLDRRSSLDDNDGSMFVRVQSGQASAAFSGDASIDAEAAMAVRPGPWRAQILKVGHHGSRGSTSKVWLNTVRPTWAVLSVGRGNRYGHPHAEALRRLTECSATCLRRDKLGAVTFELVGGRFALSKARVSP